MTTIQKQTLHPPLWVTGLFFLLGMVSGCLVAYFLRNSLHASVFSLYETLLEQLKTLVIEWQDFFVLALKKNLKYFLLLYFFAFTNVWKYYYRIFLLYTGFQNGLLLSFCVGMKGIAGAAGYLCFLLPHSLLLIPAYLVAFHLGEAFQGMVRSHSSRKTLLYRLPPWLLSWLLLTLGCLAEAAFNPSLLRLFFS